MSPSEKGQTLIVIALAAVVLFGFAGLAIDGSAKFADRRHAQNAADTAALAAALAKVNALNDPSKSSTPLQCSSTSGGPYSDVCTELLLDGLDRAVSNGYGDDTTRSTVEIHSPPISGYYSTVSNKDQFVQVIITSHVKTTFMRILGIQQTDNVVGAVAFLNKGGPLFEGAAFISVDPNPNCSGGNGIGGGSVDVTGNSVIKINGGGFFVNSDETCGFSQTSCSVDLQITGGGGILSAGSNIYMNENGTQCDPSIPTDNTQRQYMVPDEITFPDEPPECGLTAPQPTNLGLVNGVQTWRIYPGYYTDFPQASLVPNNKNIVLAPGVYCVDDDLKWSGNSFKQLDGTSGVTIWLKPGHDISLTINSPILLNASGPGSDYENYVIIQDGNMNDIRACKFTGGQYLELNGTVYTPYCDVTINGDSLTDSEFNAQFFGWDMLIDGNNKITVNYDPDYTPQIKRKIGLMK